MATFANINGKLFPADSAGISPANRALRYGYGLFETMLVRNEAIRLEAYHWDRLFAGMETLRIPAEKFFRQKLETELWRTVRKAGLEALCRVRLQVYAGDGGLFDSYFDAGFVIEAFPLEVSAHSLNEAGLVLGFAEGIKHSSNISHIKSCAALPYALAARQAKEMRWNDVLLLNEQGRICESSIANIFALSAGKWYTPPLTEGCVAGVMRQHLLKVVPEAGFQVSEQPITKENLAGAEAVFLSNAVRGIRWVRSIGNNVYNHQAVLPIHTVLSGHL